MPQLLLQQFFFSDISDVADHFVLPLAPFRLIGLRIDTNPDRFVFDSGAAFKAAMVQFTFYHLEKLVDIIARTNNPLYTFERHMLVISQVIEQFIVVRRFVQERIDKQLFLLYIVFGYKRMTGQENGFQDR